MKKIAVLSLLTIFICTGSALARVKYDQTGRTIIYDDTIRAQQRAQQAREIQRRQGMAAAKINYEAAYKSLENQPSNLKNNYIQNQK